MDELTDKWTDGWTDRHTQPLALKKEAQLSIVIAFRIRDHENGEKRTNEKQEKEEKKNPALLIGSFFLHFSALRSVPLIPTCKIKNLHSTHSYAVFLSIPFPPSPSGTG